MTPNESRALAIIADLVPGARRKIIDADMSGKDAVELFPFVRNIGDKELRRMMYAKSPLELWSNA